MKAVHVDLKTSQRPTRRAWIVIVLLFATAAGVCALALRDSRVLSAVATEQAAALQKQRTEAAHADDQARHRTAEPPPAYAEHARSAVRQQQFPLNTVLTALETVGVVGVRVIAVDIVTIEGTARAQVEFADYESLLRYLSDLNAGEPAQRWVLVSAQSQATGRAGPATALLLSVWSK